ncbi:MAG: alpha/beta hydrolase [Acidobacteria bacterium]|nr:alpha/beta hydrolase [Acidobacteriota bacterium]
MSRRRVMRWGLFSAGAAAMARALGADAFAQDFGPGSGNIGVVGGRDEKALFPGPDLPGGGQLEIRMVQSMHTSDGDELEVAQRAKPFDPESWMSEWTRVAERNERLAEEYVAAGFKQTAHEYYRRAQDFWSNATVYAAEHHPKQLYTYRKMRETFDKAWQLVRPPFERVKVPYEGKTLEGYFRKPGGASGTRFPTVIGFQGADSMAENTIMGGGSYTARGMAYLVVDLPGQGSAMRLQNLPLPPDTERVVKALVDYLATRPDVDINRLGMQGISMGGWSVPRAVTAEKRIKAVWMSSGALSLATDLFDYYPPIQDRVRWIIGAKDVAGARKMVREYTTDGRAHLIECTMLIGYGADDRIMDPQGAFRLYQAAVNAKRDMIAGLGHPHHSAKAGGPRADRPLTLQDWAMRQLRAET